MVSATCNSALRLLCLQAERLLTHKAMQTVHTLSHKRLLLETRPRYALKSSRNDDVKADNASFLDIVRSQPKIATQSLPLDECHGHEGKYGDEQPVVLRKSSRKLLRTKSSPSDFLSKSLPRIRLGPPVKPLHPELEAIHHAMKRKAQLKMLTPMKTTNSRLDGKIGFPVVAPPLPQELNRPTTPPLSDRTVARQRILSERDLSLDVCQWMKRRQKLVRRKVSEEVKRKYREIFDMIDLDGSGTIEIDELQAAMRFVGLDVSILDLLERMKVIDVNYDGDISYDEFLTGLSTISEWDLLLYLRRRRNLNERLRRLQEIEQQNRAVLAGEVSEFDTPLVRADEARRVQEHVAAEQSDIPFSLWVPAYHRLRMIEGVIAEGPTYLGMTERGRKQAHWGESDASETFTDAFGNIIGCGAKTEQSKCSKNGKEENAIASPPWAEHMVAVGEDFNPASAPVLRSTIQPRVTPVRLPGLHTPDLRCKTVDQVLADAPLIPMLNALRSLRQGELTRLTQSASRPGSRVGSATSTAERDLAAALSQHLQLQPRPSSHEGRSSDTRQAGDSGRPSSPCNASPSAPLAHNGEHVQRSPVRNPRGQLKLVLAQEKNDIPLPSGSEGLQPNHAAIRSPSKSKRPSVRPASAVAVGSGLCPRNLSASRKPSSQAKARAFSVIGETTQSAGLLPIPPPLLKRRLSMLDSGIPVDPSTRSDMAFIALSQRKGAAPPTASVSSPKYAYVPKVSNILLQRRNSVIGAGGSPSQHSEPTIAPKTPMGRRNSTFMTRVSAASPAAVSVPAQGNFEYLGGVDPETLTTEEIAMLATFAVGSRSSGAETAEQHSPAIMHEPASNEGLGSLTTAPLQGLNSQDSGEPSRQIASVVHSESSVGMGRSSVKLARKSLSGAASTQFGGRPNSKRSSVTSASMQHLHGKRGSKSAMNPFEAIASLHSLTSKKSSKVSDGGITLQAHWNRTQQEVHTRMMTRTRAKPK